MDNRDEILGRALSGALEQEPKKETCPALEEIATLVDGSLSGEARDALLGHLAVCSHCREVFSMTQELTQRDRKKWYFVSAAAAAAAVAVLALGITLRKPSSEQLKVVTIPSPQPTSVTSSETPVGVPTAAPTLTARAEKPVAVVQLLTRDEALQQEAKNFGFAGEDILKNGPEIKIVSPEPDRELNSPFKLAVRFVPKQGRSVDLSTLRVECLKIVTVDLTPRVLPYATADGISIAKASAPVGNYKIRITVADTKGGVTVEIFTLHII